MNRFSSFPVLNFPLKREMNSGQKALLKSRKGLGSSIGVFPWRFLEGSVPGMEAAILLILSSGQVSVDLEKHNLTLIWGHMRPATVLFRTLQGKGWNIGVPRISEVDLRNSIWSPTKNQDQGLTGS